MSTKPPSSDLVAAPGAGERLVLTVFYDGGCPLCRAEIGHYRACDGAERISFVDVSASAAAQLAPGLDRRLALQRFHVATPEGTLHSGADGFARLWLALPGWRRLGLIVAAPGVRQLAELAYSAFLPLRPALQWAWRQAAANRR